MALLTTSWLVTYVVIFQIVVFSEMKTSPKMQVVLSDACYEANPGHSLFIAYVVPCLPVPC